jgi:hypothetical protein
VPRVDQRTGNPRPAGGPGDVVQTGLENRVGIQIDAEGPQTRDHFADALDSRAALAGQKPHERLGVGVDEVAEHVDVGARQHRRDFDAGDERDVGFGTGGCSRRTP